MPDEEHPYTPKEALLGGDGVVQAGQSDILGLVPPDTLLGSQGNPATFRRETTLISAECPDMYSRMVTVVLAASRNTPPPGVDEENEGLPMFARVSFGTGGAQSRQQLEVDFLNGTIFNVPGSFLRVDAVLEASVPEDTQIGMNASIFLGYLPTGRTRSAQRTVDAGIIAAAGTTVIAVPFFANRVEVFGAALGVTYDIEQFPDFAATTLLAAAAIPAPAPVRSVPLLNATRYILIRNTTGAPVATRATFHLVV